MELRAFAARVKNVAWIDDNRFQGECPKCASGLHGTDSECNLIAYLDEDLLKLVCFAGHDLDQTDFVDTTPPPPGDEEPEEQDSPRPHSQTSTAQAPRNDSAAFSTNGTGASSNGHANASEEAAVDYATWRYRVGMVIKKALDDVPEKERPAIATVELNKLIDLLVKQAHEVVDEHVAPWWPLPAELSETDVDEELHALAAQAGKIFRATYAPPRPQEEEQEEQVRVFSLQQLYDYVDEWDRYEWPLEGILPPSSIALLVGKSETGKSTWIYAFVRAVILGLIFFGRQCQKGRVLYLAGDPMSEVVAGKLFKSWGLSEGVAIVPDALVMHRDGIEQLHRIVKDLKPTVIIGDTLGSTVDLNVDSYSESYKAQMPLVKLVREYKTLFLGSHHSQKQAMDSYSVIDAALGSVGVAAVASARMVTRLHRRSGKQFYTFEMSNLRIGNPIKGEYIVKKYDDGQVDMMGLWKSENMALDKELILAILVKRDGPMSKRTLWNDCRPKPKWEPFNDALDELFAEGKITTEEGKRGAKLYKAI